MTVIQISQNENKLPDLVQRVSRGERIVLVNGIEPVAEIVPYNEKPTVLKFGLLKGQLEIPDNFDRLFENDAELFQEYMPD